MNENIEQSRWERVKQHFARNKKLYIGLGIGVVVGAVGGHALSRPEEDGVGSVAIDVSESQVQIGDDNHIDNSVTNNFYGHSTKIVKCLETGEVWETVYEAAEDVGVGRTTMSKHLNGRTEHIDGLHYEIIGQGTAG